MRIPVPLILLLATANAAATTLTPLPRIGIHTEPGRPGYFVERETGTRFHPRGFNHTVLGGDIGWHYTFNVGTYDPDAMEKTLAEMASLGANVIRVWAWATQDATGFTGDPDSTGMNEAYLDNFVDFLSRATRHRMYVLPIFDRPPRNAGYRAIHRAHTTEDAAGFAGYNAFVLDPGWIAATAQGVQDFVNGVKARNPALLSTVLGWAFANEQFFTVAQPPFDRLEGTITPATGRTYDLADPAQRRACADESVLLWANRLSAALKEADPYALATVGMWTADAHGRAPDNGLPHDGRDPRVPPRPSVLGGADSDLDFIGVHIYPWDRNATVRAKAHERAAVIAAGTPALVGEYGVFPHQHSIEEARAMLPEMLEQAYAMGYAGDLFWVWDLRHIEYQTYSAVEHGFGAFVMCLPVSMPE